MVSKEIRKWSKKDLRKAEKVITAMNALGLSDEDIDLLPEIAKNWKRMVGIVNAHSDDIADIKRTMANERRDPNPKANDSYSNIMDSVGAGKATQSFMMGKKKEKEA